MKTPAKWIADAIGIPSKAEIGEYCHDWDYAQVDDRAVIEGDAAGDQVGAADALRSIDSSQYFTSMLELAKQGSVRAMNRVGCCYRYGEAVAVDLDQAEYWFRRAFEEGSEFAQLQYGHRLATRGDAKGSERVFRVGAMKAATGDVLVSTPIA